MQQANIQPITSKLSIYNYQTINLQQAKYEPTTYKQTINLQQANYQTATNKLSTYNKQNINL